jgi:hypothetical protein
MKKKLAILFLAAAGAALAHGRFFVGFDFGGWGWGPGVLVPFAAPYVAYPAPLSPAVAYAPPVYPGLGYTWIAGYYYPVGPRWVWRPGYWAARPWAGAVWVGPRWSGGRWSAGYWRR